MRLHAAAWRAHGGGGLARPVPARAATLYVTLEPCAHFGRTPPCTNAVLQAGIARGCRPGDPHDVVAAVNARLRCAQVSVGVCEAEARALLQPYQARAQACPTAS